MPDGSVRITSCSHDVASGDVVVIDTDAGSSVTVTVTLDATASERGQQAPRQASSATGAASVRSR
ncbi:hypothetical protein [Streptomyces sp. NPDC052721]|uniref:hypothetical protein n=1 Tax=Streptomyces sp. NPDC052721 TaxID=3154955 RepID=UPI00343D272B